MVLNLKLLDITNNFLKKFYLKMIVCRWASARKGGMKVLGKVPVPKPINLPSQRYLGFFSITCGFI
jgi:hypothetical protein